MPLLVSKKDAAKYGAKQDAAGNYVVGGSSSKKSSSGGGLSSKNQKTLDALKKGGGNQQIEGTENYGVSGTKIVPRFKSTSPVLSSNDLEASFGKDSEKITGLANAGQNVLDTGALQDEKAKAMGGNKEQTPGTDEYAEGIDKYYQGAKKQNEDWKKQATADVDNLFNQSRAAYDSQYRASVQSISSTYARLIETQSKINQQVTDRTKAYGASGGNALYTPMEFTDAVAIKEREAANEIAGLETERNAKIAQALADRDEGRALSLSQKLKDIREIDDTIYSRMADIEKEVQRREKLQLEAWKDLQDQQKQRAMEVLELYKGKYLQDFRDAETFEDKQKIIERIAAETGGAVSPGQIFSAFGAAATDALKGEQDAEKHALDIEGKKLDMSKKKQDMALDWRKYELDVRKENRIASGEKADKGFKFSNDNRGKLLGSGLSEEDIDAVQEDVRKHGGSAVLEGFDDEKQKSALRDVLGIREEVLSDTYIKDTFSDSDLRKAAKKAGFTEGASVWKNDDGVGEEGLNKYVASLMQRVETLRRAGKSEDAILKEIEKLVNGE